MTVIAQTPETRRTFDEIAASFPIRSDADRSYVERAKHRMWLTLARLPDGGGHGILLDVGSMHGLFAPAYIELWRYAEVQLLGSDVTTGTVERRIGDRVLTFKTARANIETEAWSFADETFDTVICTEVLEHLIFDPVFALNEMCRVLKPGGVALITVPNAASDTCLTYLVNDMQPGFLRHYIADALKSGRRDLDTVYNLGHYHEYTGPELRAAAEATGFAVEHLDGLAIRNPPLQSARFRFLLQIVHALFPRSRRVRESHLIALLRKECHTPLERLAPRYPPPLYRPLAASSEKISE